MVGNRPQNSGLLSPSGVFGDATLATADKGRRLTESVIVAALKDVGTLRAAALPPARAHGAAFVGLEGEYEIAAGDTIAVRRDGDMLAVRRAGRPEIRLQQAGPYRFGLWTTEVRFFVDDRGMVTNLMLSDHGLDLLAKKIVR